MPLSTIRDECHRKKKGEIKTERVPGVYCKWVMEEEGVVASEKSPEWGEGCPTEKASGWPWGCGGLRE